MPNTQMTVLSTINYNYKPEKIAGDKTQTVNRHSSHALHVQGPGLIHDISC